MSVEGVPSVDDVARELAPQVLHGVTSTDLRHAAEAVHALYAPVLADLVQDRDEWEAVAQTERRRTAAVEVAAARHREALDLAEGSGGTER